jgi:CCR4-NOT transcription complex subunit 1
VAPRVVSQFQAVLQAGELKQNLDAFLSSPPPPAAATAAFLAGLPGLLLHNAEDVAATGARYNAPLVNALVLYVGTRTLEATKAAPDAVAMTRGPHMDLLQHLAASLDTEGRYLLFTAVANQLRFPNSHTHFFSCVLLFLFAEAQQEIVQEQITRVLLERLIVNRPHPWGLLITFIELIQNRSYNFWSHEFVHCGMLAIVLLTPLSSSLTFFFFSVGN